MIILQCNSFMTIEAYTRMHKMIMEQAQTGILFLPECVDLLTVTPETEIEIIKEEKR